MRLHPPETCILPWAEWDTVPFRTEGLGAALPQQKCSDLLQCALPGAEHRSLSGMRNVAAVLLGRLSGSKMPLSRLKWSWAATAASQKAFRASSKSQRILARRLWRSPEEVTQTLLGVLIPTEKVWRRWGVPWERMETSKTEKGS